jgi:hypothetical protein
MTNFEIEHLGCALMAKFEISCVHLRAAIV